MAATATRCRYTADMKTVVSLPEKLVRRVEKLAKLRRRSRSHVIRTAIVEYLERHDDDAITGALNRVADRIDTSLPPDMRENSIRMLRRVEW
jgi:metal-responsive CopG/Arc/MetJ family transcriptional regulator